MEAQQKGIIAWFTRNPVAANLLMVMIILFGIVSAFTIRKQAVPDFELNFVNVRVPYLGAAPQEVEEGVVVKVEEAISDLPGIVEINSSAAEGIGTITAEISLSSDIDQALNDIKTRVDAIATFPALAEKPVIYKVDAKVHVVFISIYGELDEYGLKTVAQDVRDDLLALPAVNQVEILSDRPYEISIEVSEHTLRQYSMTLSDVADAIRRSSVDLPGGTIKSDRGNILLRTEGQVYRGIEFATLILRTNPDGSRVTLGDIATIRDGFVEDNGFANFNGKPTAIMRVLATSQQSELLTAKLVNEYATVKNQELPDGVAMQVWGNQANYLQARLDMMLKNMGQGALLVFIILTLFLRLKVAIWVIIGIPITFFGALWLMPLTPWPTTINMISLFGFILVLGIVVDDAIIIAESIYTKVRADGHTIDNVITGAHHVAVAATFGVLTTIAAFAPTLFVGGIVGPFFEAMSAVVILCLIFSLIESKLILPAHLAHTNFTRLSDETLYQPYREMRWWQVVPRFFQRFQRRVQNGMQSLINNHYERWLRKAISARGITVTLFFSMLIITAGMIGGGKIRAVLFPEIESDFIQVFVEMKDGSSLAQRDDVLLRLEAAVLEVNKASKRLYPDEPDPAEFVATIATSATGGFLVAELSSVEGRTLTQSEVTEQWRERAGEIPGVRKLEFSDGNNVGGGAALSFKLMGDNSEALEGAAAELADHLAEFGGVFDIENSSSQGSSEIQLSIKSGAESLGLNIDSIGRQVRQAFYGEEAQRIQRQRDELKVMVRYPESERRSIADLKNMRIRTSDGSAVPIRSVAELSYGKSYSTISRQNRKRAVTVSADINTDVAEPSKITTEVREEYIPELLARYPGVEFALEGASQEEQKFIANLTKASFAALIMIYALIAIPLRSYTQPLMIMSVIPFGFIGAATGHLIAGVSISMFSLFGLIALAGVVVNDSLIMVDFINRAKRAGMDSIEAVVQSGTKRFRAIILTSLTTAAGLMPIMFETSTQAQFVIPMAISISFGILFATVITLFLVPSLYLLGEDFRIRWRRLRLWLRGEPSSREAALAFESDQS